MPSDEALYERLLEGDLRAFDQLYNRYERLLFGFIRTHLPDTTEAEEVFHESFMAVLCHRDQGRSIHSFKAWLYRVARNACLNRQRERKRAARAMAEVTRAAVSAAHEPEPEAALLREERAAALRMAVERLPAPMRELYALRASGLSYKELADVLGVPLGTVKSRVHKMIRCLQQEMEQ